MEQKKKKSAKKAFSVPCGKGEADRPVDFISDDKASSLTRKETGSTEGKKHSTDKDKKVSKPKSGVAKTMKSGKTTGRGTSASSKKTPRSLTDAEFEAIFQAVLEDPQEEDSQVFMAPTQIDNPTGMEEKCCSMPKEEEDHDLDSSDKENLPRRENREDGISDDDRMRSDKDDVSKPKRTDVRNKARHDKDNSVTKKSCGKKDGSGTMANSECGETKEKEMGDVMEKKYKKKNVKHTKDAERESVEKDDHKEVGDGKKKRQKIKMERKNNIGDEHGNKQVNDDTGAKKDKTNERNNPDKNKRNEESTLLERDLLASADSEVDTTTKEDQETDTDGQEQEPHSVGRDAEKSDVKSRENQGDEHKKREKDSLARKRDERMSEKACKGSKDQTKQEQSDVQSMTKPKNTTKYKKGEKDEENCKQESKDEAECTENKKGKKKTGKRKKDSKEEGEYTENKKAHTKTKEGKKESKDEADEKEVQQNADPTKKESKADKKVPKKTDPTKKESKEEAEEKKTPVEGEKSELSCEGKEEKGATPKEQEEKSDADSVVSGQSLDSSLMDMAQAVDQWDRLDEIRENNEHTPHASEAETKEKISNPRMLHKPKEKKQRENQLAPRKLSFDAAAESRKKNQHVQDSDSVSSVPADLGTWVQCEARSCQKWRYLSDTHDPLELPERWLCSMNKDKRYDSCDAPEQDYDEADHIFTPYTLGSLVWVKLDGFPWWPSMVDTDPDDDMYCHLPHEDSMVPTYYHVVFLDEKVTRSWVRHVRIQPLSADHLAPGSIFMKGHKFKKEMQVAMRRAEVALNMPLQDRLKCYGFSACFRNLNTKWTKAEAKPKNPRKKKAPKVTCRSSASGPSSFKKRRLMADKPLSEDDSSDSDSSASNSDDSSLPLSSDGGDDDDSDDVETIRRRFLATKQRRKKGELSVGRKVLPVGGRPVEHQKMDKGGLGGLKSSKKSKLFGKSAGGVSEIDGGVKTNGHRRESKVYSSDSESDVDVTSTKGSHWKFAKVAKPPKKKFKSEKKRESKFVKEHLKPKDLLSALNLAEKGTIEKGKKEACKKKLPRDRAPPGKENTDERSQNRDSGKKSKAPKKIKHGDEEKTSGDQPGKKKKKKFQSEKSKQRDEAVKQEKETLSASAAESKAMRTKPQKFVAPVKPASEEAAAKLAPSVQMDHSSDEDDHKPEQTWNESKDSGAKSALAVPEEQGQPPNLKERVQVEESAAPSSSKPCAKSPTPVEETLTPVKTSARSPFNKESPGRSAEETLTSVKPSSVLSSRYKDQFVPSMDSHSEGEEGSGKEGDQLSLMEHAPTTSAYAKSRGGGGRAVTPAWKGGREDSDSDCLDLEEDLPIPSLQQVMGVPYKGSSDRDSVLSDPLEMAED